MDRKDISRSDPAIARAHQFRLVQDFLSTFQGATRSPSVSEEATSGCGRQHSLEEVSLAKSRNAAIRYEAKVAPSTPEVKQHRPLRRTRSWEYVYIPNLPYFHENENLYRGILRSLLHPLGAPETQVGLRPGDLIDHVRQVFDIDQEDQEYFIRDEIQSKPRRIQADISVVEARDLKIVQGKEDSHPYCLLTMVQPVTKSAKNHSPKGSPKVSPRTSRKGSPKVKRSPPRSPSFDAGDVLRSQPAKSCKQPKWNEHFQLDVEDPLVDEINLCICHYDDNVTFGDSSSRSHSEKTGALKGFFRNVLQTTDSDHLIPGCIGRVILPVKDVPSHGFDGWVNVHPVSGSSRSKPVGQCHLQVTLSHKQDSVSGAYGFTAEDYHLAALLCFKQAILLLKDCYNQDLTLSPKSRRVLDIFAVVSGISRLSQRLMELTVLLEMAAGHAAIVTNSVLHKSLEDLQMTWVSQQIYGHGYMQKMPLTDTEICLYRQACRRYLSIILQQLDQLPPLFPFSTDSFAVLKQRFSIARHLLELDLWDADTSPQRDLSASLLAKLQADIGKWVDVHLKTLETHDLVKDAIIPEAEALLSVITALTSHCTPLGVAQQFLTALGLNYYRIVSFETERKVAKVVRELMMGMDKYQLRYHGFPVNIETSSRLSLSLFFAVRGFYHTVRDNLADRDLFRLTISQYQGWFHESLVFWLQTFKTECLSRMERALEIDKDMVVATSLVKFSNSSVDVLSCFSKITEEWRLIDFQDADSAAMGVTKITDLISDGARLYADKVHSILERNCYYDEDNGQFDVTDRLCITLNNIEHVRQYLNKLPQLLQWAAVSARLSTRHESERVGRQSLITLRRLVNTAHADILLKSSLLLREIAEKMKVDIQRYMDEFLLKNPEKRSAADDIIGYLDTNLETLHARLSTTIYPNMIHELWAVVLAIFDNTMLSGRKPEYYEQIKMHLKTVAAFFISRGLDEEKEINSLFTELRARVDLNCLSSQQLILEYYNTLANSMGTPLEYLGHLALKMAYVEETRGNVTIFLKVISGSDLPGLDRSGLSDPYVTVGLQPRCIFSHKPQRTKVIGQTVQPVFNTVFQFPNVPKEYLTVQGAVFLLSVFDYDRFGSDDFAGEIILHLANVPRISMDKGVDSVPVVMMPLKRPASDANGPLEVLRERAPWDPMCKAFLHERSKFMEKKQKCTVDRWSLRNIFSVFSSSLSWMRGRGGGT